MMVRVKNITCLLSAVIVFLHLSVGADTDKNLASRVLVIRNQNSPISVEIALDYLKKRHIRNVLNVRCPDSAINSSNETMGFDVFQETIEKPLIAYLAKHPNIDFLVLTKGIPIRLTQAPVGLGGNRPSLDSYLASLDYASRKDTVKTTVREGGDMGTSWHNRYWNAQERFSHAKYGGYLVTRLDGYSASDAKGLVDHALEAERVRPRGPFLLDTHHESGIGDLASVPRAVLKMEEKERGTLNEMDFKEYNADMVVTAKSLAKMGFDVILNQDASFIGSDKPLAGYCSWGSNDSKYNVSTYRGLGFVPGAIAETAVSTSARTFLPTEGGQSLIADLIHNGVTGIKGYCDEPYLIAVASPTILFERYIRGWTLAESFYCASRVVGWEDIVIGDPLCRVYVK
jgi:uncharacterized protein (TIGR03790 family)